MRAPIDAVCRWLCHCGHRNPIWRAQCRRCGADREFKAGAA
ncbi:hypothetical protein PV413_03575 [Streptomyces scabiei]|nr:MULTISPECIES: hypothetical protein [Streptomyces]MDX2652185.1 hypothetical protein [Streptomyces scabiei]MDX2725789.1 hypothetical protein [Streptomyces scabiei]MDX2749578.1 hypothetical protein [Streptomyces scabiei]MDX2863908.1 hypothetical protein [Streptomyces scabiei]MDX2881832.1 hypothetical protein [Streptomyces scabiei]